jgi:RNA polymerase sigma-B factor
VKQVASTLRQVEFVMTTPASTLYRRVGASSTDAHASALIIAYASAPESDPRRAELRDRAVQAWLPLAQHLSRRYYGHGESPDDLFQVAVVGLLKAVDRFRLDREADFAAFAIPTVLGEIKRHFRDRTWSVRIPRRLQELWAAIRGADADLSARLGRSPSVTEVAAHLGVTEDEVLEGLEGGRAYLSTSLSAPVGAEGSIELGDSIGAVDGRFELTDNLLALGPALAGLPERQRHILSLYFYEDLTQVEIATRIGISQMQVSRLLNKAIGRLRSQLLDDGVGPARVPRPRNR